MQKQKCISTFVLDQVLFLSSPSCNYKQMAKIYHWLFGQFAVLKYLHTGFQLKPKGPYLNTFKHIRVLSWSVNLLKNTKNGRWWKLCFFTFQVRILFGKQRNSIIFWILLVQLLKISSYEVWKLCIIRQKTKLIFCKKYKFSDQLYQLG